MEPWAVPIAIGEMSAPTAVEGHRNMTWLTLQEAAMALPQPAVLGTARPHTFTFSSASQNLLSAHCCLVNRQETGGPLPSHSARSLSSSISLLLTALCCLLTKRDKVAHLLLSWLMAFVCS